MRELSADIERRIRREIPPLLIRGQLSAAEDKLTEWLRGLPPSPFHVAIDPGVAITTDLRQVVDYLNEFIDVASKSQPPKALYAEMNAFTINPDAWFFGLFAFALDGGREDYDWLADFYASTQDGLLITGMEKLQQVYAKPGDHHSEHRSAGSIAETLVIVRFQRMLQQSLPLMQRKLPLLASAHDYDSYTVQIIR
jgi:hypothetical protein